MKALFYGGAISALAGLALGIGMAVPADAPAPRPDPQPVAQQVADYAPASDATDIPASYPPYFVDAVYTGDPAELSPQTVSSPAETAADSVLQASWREPAEPSAATPQDVAAAGDTTAAPEAPQAPPEVRTYASIDALLNQQQAAKGRLRDPSF